MKKLMIYSIAAVLLLTMLGCKSRQVSLQVSKTEDHSFTDQKITKDSVHTDTGKTFTQFKSELMAKDSFDIVITTDTGIVSVVNGSFTGKAKSISIKGNHALTNNVFKAIEDLHAETTKVSVTDSAHKQTDITLENKNKETKTKPDYSWILWVAGIGILLFVGFSIYHALKPKP